MCFPVQKILFKEQPPAPFKIYAGYCPNIPFSQDRLNDPDSTAGPDAACAWEYQQIFNGSTLALLVLGILADDHDPAFSLDNLALIAHRLHRRSYFHF